MMNPMRIMVRLVQPIPLGVTFSKAQSSKLERLVCHVSVKRDVRALSFELWNSVRKCHPKLIGCTKLNSDTSLVQNISPPHNQTNLFPKLIRFFYVETHTVSTYRFAYIRGGFMFYYTKYFLNRFIPHVHRGRPTHDFSVNWQVNLNCFDMCEISVRFLVRNINIFGRILTEFTGLLRTNTVAAKRDLLTERTGLGKSVSVSLRTYKNGPQQLWEIKTVPHNPVRRIKF